MSEITVIEDAKQVNALLSETRRKMMCQMAKSEMTISQLASTLGKSPATIHYHMEKLLNAGLAVLTKIRIVNNNLVEKYYTSKIRSSFIVAVRLKPKLHGPVPPKGYGKIESCATIG